MELTGGRNQALSPREARAGREPERRVPNPNSLPTLSSLWQEREKKLASGSPDPRVLSMHSSQIESDFGLESDLQSKKPQVRRAASSRTERHTKVIDTRYFG